MRPVLLWFQRGNFHVNLSVALTINAGMNAGQCCVGGCPPVVLCTAAAAAETEHERNQPGLLLWCFLSESRFSPRRLFRFGMAPREIYPAPPCMHALGTRAAKPGRPGRGRGTVPGALGLRSVPVSGRAVSCGLSCGSRSPKKVQNYRGNEYDAKKIFSSRSLTAQHCPPHTPCPDTGGL
ncbi:unnamed protein product [Pylaiella littoralis]